MEGTGAQDVTLEQRLRECRQGGPRAALNLGYLGEGALPENFVALVLRVNPHVTELDLSSNQLSHLPGNLAELRELRVVRCKYNALQSLPSVLASLPKLTLLELSGNQIEQLDGSILSQLTSLRDLDLSGNGLKAVPESVAALPNLETLRLGNNALEHLPLELGACPSLVRLDVSSNRLLDLPHSLAQLQKIQRIDCKTNFLTRVPPCLGHLRALKEFDLRYNRLNNRYQQATEKGLARFLNFLRDEEEIERLAEIERNKPVGQQVGPCMVYKCRALTADVLGSPGKEGEDEFAWIRTGHALSMAGKMVYMFGGSLMKDPSRKTADLLWLSTDRMEWRLQPTKGDKPCPRDGHCMVIDTACDRLVVFGGRKQNKRRLNDIYFLDLVTWTWFQPRTEGEVPSPRDQCTALYYDNKMFIFGGRSSTSRLNELHVLDLDAWTWMVPEASGTVPSPRQAAALSMHEDKLWVHGGMSNFVLDDTFTLDLESGEWSAVPTAGRIMPARHGHAIVHFKDTMYLFGGTDALGASVPSMYKLRQAGVTKYEWVETTFSLPPNKHRNFIFANERLNVLQVGHTALKMHVPPADLASGRALWDIVQWVNLKDMKEKPIQPEDLIPQIPKLERITHCTAEVAGSGRLPPSFTSNSSREQQVMQRISQFKESWRQRQQQVDFEPPLVLRNECGTEKIVCTTIRPTCLQHVELHDMDGILQFVSEYFKYEPLEHPSQPPSHLVSPWSLLDWQAGDSFDLATVECSLLLGAGYNACIAVGFAPKHIALNDQSQQDCPYLAGLGITQRPPTPCEAGNDGVDATGEEGAGDGCLAGRISTAGAMRRRDGLGRITEGEEANCIIRSPLGSRPATAATATGPEADVVSQPPGSGELEGELEVGTTADVAGSEILQPGAAGSSPRADAAQPAADTQRSLGICYESAAASTSTGAEANEAAASAEAGPESGSSGLEPGSLQEGVAGTEQHLVPPVPAGPPRYIHAFVLVRPGSREMSHPLFIDPATGLCFSPEEVPCEGIIFIWNQNNIWANLQRADGCLAAPGATDWTLGNPNAWEAVLPNAQDLSDSQSVSTEFSGASSFLRTLQSNASVLELHQPSTLSCAKLTPRSTAASAVPGTLRSQRKSLSLAVGTKTAGTPGLVSHNPQHREFDGGSLSYLAPSFGTEESNVHGSSPGAFSWLGRHAGLSPEASEMPASWVPPLVLSRERLDVRCPKGLKRIAYRQCQREILARFGECSRWDGLVERYTLFEDAECTAVEVIVELFQRRKDRLQRRETYPAQRLVRDSFGPGATAAVKQSSVVKGERRELTFYHEARADGLIRRVEAIGISMEEYFVGRLDRLVSRKIKYGPPDLAFLGLMAGLPRRGSLMAIKRDSVTPGEGGRKASVMSGPGSITYPFAKITEKFSRDASITCDQDVAKRAFELDDDKTITATCHYGEDEQGMARLTRAVRIYNEFGEVLQNSGAANPPSPEWCKLEYLRLAAAKKAAEAAGHAAEDESQDIMLSRMRQEQNVQLITGHYDAPRNKVEDSDDEPEGPEEDTDDYLAPFLPAITGTRAMTAAEAAHVFGKCLQALRDRAAERSFVLAARKGADTAEIKRLEGSELLQLSAGEQKRLQEQLADAKFRAGVLEKRIQDHDVVTREKLVELEAKLRADPRLLPAVKARLV